MQGSAKLRAASRKFRIYIAAGIYSIVFEYIYFSEITWIYCEL